MTRWASLLAGLGAVALGFGLLTLILAAFQPVASPAWVMGNLVVGVVLLGTALVVSFDDLRERISSGEGRRAGKYGTSALLSALLLLAIFGTLGWLSTQYNKRFDWTEAGVHTLTPQTLGILDGLESDVAVTAFFNKLDAPGVRDLLQRYEYANDRFKLEFADPTERPDLVAAYQIEEEDLARGLVRIAIGEESLELGEFSESEITNALVKLTRAGDKKVYFVEGHNERSIDPESNTGSGNEGMARAAQALRNETYEVETLLLAATADVPDDADALILAGPTRPYMDAEHEALKRYVERGGALLVLLDPRANTDLHLDLEAWGVQVGDDVIVDPLRSLPGRPTTPFLAGYSEDHPITRELREVVLFDMVRSVALDPSAEGRLETLAFTGESSWAERDLEGWKQTGRAELGEEDRPGPVPLAIVGNPLAATADAEAPDARLVVIGDSDFATNEILDVVRNRDFFVNSVNWLVGDVESISIRPNESRASHVQLSAEQMQRIQYLSLFLVPESIAVIGVIAWWLRRRSEATSAG